MAKRSAAARAERGTTRATNVTPRTAPAPQRGAAPGELDRIIHDRTRLAIVSALAVHQELSFTDLKGITGTTDGNLSVHARRLEEAGYLACEKSFAGRTPRTDYRLTDAGRKALGRYLDHMDAIIRATRKAGS